MFAVILLPDFRLQSALRMRPELRSQPIAVVDERTNKGLVLELNAAAATSGVAVGMPSPQALARCPTMTLLPRALAQEEAAQAALIEVALSLSPEVESTADGWATIDLRMGEASGAIGNRKSEIGNVPARLAALDLTARVGVGPNPDLAYLAARRAAPVLVVHSPAAFLSQLAVAEIEPPPHLLALLHDWGITTLGQLTSLPRGEFADRLGPEADRLWQRAAGQTQRLLRLVRPVEEFVEAFDFGHEIETSEPLLFLLRRFVDQLALRLEGAHRVAARMTLAMPLDQCGMRNAECGIEESTRAEPNRKSEIGNQKYERSFTIPAPTADPEVLFRILSTHLESLRLEQRPTGVRLQIEPAPPDHRQLRLFESALRDANRFAETVARLAALVGNGNVGVAEVEDTHRPDRFQIAAPKFHELRERDTPADEGAIGLPLRRFRPPVTAHVQLLRHEPVQLESAIARGRIIAVMGPYRAGGGWWDRDAWVDEEWDVQLAAGGLYRLSRRDQSWFLEGCYDRAPEASRGAVVEFELLESEEHRTSNVEHRTSNSPVAALAPGSMFDVRRSTFDVQPPVTTEKILTFPALAEDRGGGGNGRELR